ncbi:hypothetical protein BGX38DRAFT_156867 [Terfezia claveryi]|nr:hypothetical protein BGX38DRAFT_156867 [Terfezia claveryi]
MAWRAAIEETAMKALPVLLGEVAPFEEQPLAAMCKSITSTSSEVNTSNAEQEDEEPMGRFLEAGVVEAEVVEIAKNVKELILQSGLDEKPSSAKQRVDSGSLSTAPATIKTRAYQQEMFEESLKRNIIVCQGTGSGKTHVYRPSFPPSVYILQLMPQHKS